MTSAIARSQRLAPGLGNRVTAWMRCAALAGLLAVAVASPAAPVPQARAAIEPPVADAGTAIATHVHQPVTIDGSNSFDGAADSGDPQRGLIDFRWSIVQAPSGSSASIDATSPAPVLVPDLAGNYMLQLQVVAADGRISAPAQTTVTAYDGNAAPVALADTVRTVAVHAPVVLDASASFDPDGGALAFAWSFGDVPAQSHKRDGDLIDARSASARFTPDVAGDYLLLLQVGDGQFVTEARTLVHARTGVLPPDAEPRALVDGDHIVLDATMSVDTNAVPRPLHYAWGLVARPAVSVATREAIRDADAAHATFAPDVDGLYVFRLRAGNGVEEDARNVLVRFARAQRDDKVGTSATPIATLTGRSPQSKNSNVASSAGVLRLQLNLHPRALDVTAGGQGAIDVKLVASGHAPGDGDEPHGPERNNKSRNASVSASLSASGLPAGVAVRFADAEIAPGETTTMTVTTAATTPPGVYRLQLTASPLGADVAVVPTSNVTLHVRPPLRAAQVACGTVDLSRFASKIHVSPTGSHNSGCGALASPCATIQLGVDSCAGTGCAVLVRYGRYVTTQPITLKDGVSVYGGCTFGTVPSPGYRSVVDAQFSGAAAVQANAINSATVLSGLVVARNDETAYGAPSIAMTVNQSKGLSLANMLLSSGRGGAGTPGNSIVGQAGPGGAGLDGKHNGVFGASCVANHTSSAGNGGSGGLSANGMKTDSGCVVASPAATAGQSSGSVAGGSAGPTGADGLWCPGRPHDYPGPGILGGNGNAGSCGAAAHVSAFTAGSFAGTAWSPSSGDNGQPGSVGSGGGGGGAGGVCAYYTNNDIAYYGLTGGGGGGGGCGGPAGGGGQQGGASIPLVVVDSTLGFDSTRNSIVPGPGGTGGDAGSAGTGGQGGGGGDGNGDGQVIYLGHKCGGQGAPGGNGGYGGAGSAGAGGDGGPSIGMALVGASSPPTSDSGIYPPQPGGPGKGGSGGAAAPVQGACTGPDGQWAVAGLAATTYTFDGKPVNNFVAAGDQLVQGQSRWSLDGTVEFTLQTDGNLCLYKSGAYRWCSLQNGYGTGDTVVMDPSGYICLNTGPSGYCFGAGGVYPGAYLVVQNDGHLVEYQGVTPIWQVP